MRRRYFHVMYSDDRAPATIAMWVSVKLNIQECSICHESVELFAITGILSIIYLSRWLQKMLPDHKSICHKGYDSNV